MIRFFEREVTSDGFENLYEGRRVYDNPFLEKPVSADKA